MAKATAYLGELVPMSEDDKYVLVTIYGTRLRTLTFVHIYLLIAVIPATLIGTWRYCSKIRDYSDFYTIAIAGFVTLSIAIMFSALTNYKYRIICFKQDAALGMKQVVHSEIISKQYFPITDQYFVALNDVNYLHHEVDAETYNLIEEGDSIPIYFAPKSRYAFNLRSSFAIM